MICIFDGVGWNFPVWLRAITRLLPPTYGKFVAEPFERGFGVTIGNGLRRILLSSLEGSAMTQIKVARRPARVHHAARRRRRHDRRRA